MKYEDLLEEVLQIKMLSEHKANEYKRKWNPETNLWSYEHREKVGLGNRDGYVVHHKNGNHHDNRKYNLVRLSRAEHAAIEKPALKHEKCKICGDKHFGRGFCSKHYWLLVTKPKQKKLKKK